MLGLGIIGTIIIGGIAGWIASKIIGNDGQQGIIGNVVVGVIGGFLGGIILKLITGLHSTNGFSLIGSFITAVVGAVILLWVLNKVRSR